MTKPTKWHVHPAKTQISLGFRPVWSESSLSARRKLMSLATHWAHSEDSDQTGRTVIWFALSRGGSFIIVIVRFSVHLPTEPCHEIMVLFVLRNLILQTRMCSHPVGVDVWFFVGHFVYFHTLCVRTAKALARLRGCAGSPVPSLVAYLISTIMSWAGSICVRFV